MPSLKRIPKVAVLLAALAVAGGMRPAAPAAEAGAPETATDFCGALMTAMKRGPSLDFAGRRNLLAPEIRRDFDLALMTRIVVGPPWRSLAPADRRELVEAFSLYCIDTYADRFRSYSGEHFEVDPVPAVLPRGDRIVRTKLFTDDPAPVQLDYRMEKSGARWRIIDVYLSGTISELAVRRSEYSSVLRTGGAPALVALLRKKAADLESQRPGSS